MACVSSQLIQEVNARAQSDNLEDAREICADGNYFPNNIRIIIIIIIIIITQQDSLDRYKTKIILTDRQKC